MPQPQAAAFPQPFAVYRTISGQEAELVAWGMTLPDGSAVTVGWNTTTQACGVLGICATPDSAARIYGAYLVWPTPSD